MATKKPNLLDRNPTYKPGPIPFCPLDGHMLVYERDTTKVNKYGWFCHVCGYHFSDPKGLEFSVTLTPKSVDDVLGAEEAEDEQHHQHQQHQHQHQHHQQQQQQQQQPHQQQQHEVHTAHVIIIRESARRLIAAIGDEAIRATAPSAQPHICGVDHGVDLVLGWHDGSAAQAAKAYAAIQTVCAARAAELIAEHGAATLVNKKHDAGGVIYGLRVVKLTQYTREERRAILYLTEKIDDETLIEKRLDELEELERTGRMQPLVLLLFGV